MFLKWEYLGTCIQALLWWRQSNVIVNVCSLTSKICIAHAKFSRKNTTLQHKPPTQGLQRSKGNHHNPHFQTGSRSSLWFPGTHSPRTGHKPETINCQWKSISHLHLWLSLKPALVCRRWSPGRWLRCRQHTPCSLSGNRWRWSPAGRPGRLSQDTRRGRSTRHHPSVAHSLTMICSTKSALQRRSKIFQTFSSSCFWPRNEFSWQLTTSESLIIYTLRKRYQHRCVKFIQGSTIFFCLSRETGTIERDSQTAHEQICSVLFFMPKTQVVYCIVRYYTVYCTVKCMMHPTKFLDPY